MTPQARKLANRNKRSVKENTKYAIQQCRLQKLQGRLDNLMGTIPPGTALSAYQEEMEREDAQKTEIQLGGGKRCQKIRRPPQPFSPAIWGIDLIHRAYVNMEAWHKGNKKSNGNVFRTAARADISSPETLTVEDCAAGAAACRKLIKAKELEESHLRREHLHNRYELAMDLRNTAKCNKIKEIIKRKELQDEWHRIKQATVDPHTGTTNLFQCKEGAKVIILEASAMDAEIQRITEKQFELANSEPIQNLSLQQLVCFCASSIFSKELLQGKLRQIQMTSQQN